MLFMQFTTKYTDKLQKCAESKLIDKETGGHVSSSNEQGSRWAVEVESQLRVFPIMIKNINLSGQMLIEMLYENCTRVLEIAEAIKILGMTILKGSTEACGGKIWICFVVEGQNNRNVHRMDILWSLVQILQPKIDS
ncbi:Transcription factor like [Heracleum sosnowskyi]|uniref:Transcription factor like n=1 Tax=Heracleum sosnowskyi TaxID=360622 RepID=A0AAD8IFT2_9APIA|nr:Transcription factor like [Heracleum sosnowskyi]